MEQAVIHTQSGDALIAAIPVAERTEERKAQVLVAAMRKWKKLGFSDKQIAHAFSIPEQYIRAGRGKYSVSPTYRLVDTCAAEFEAATPYYYSTYGTEDEVRDTPVKKIIILGGGPNRIGQGIEFDYCCVHASFALREAGFETVMVNCNPETVSTDYDTSDRLYFEPLTIEDVLEVCEREQPVGVVIQFGGQTPLKLAKRLLDAGVPILGTPFHAIDLAEDRRRFGSLLDSIGLKAPAWAIAHSVDEAVEHANRIGYPVLVRPSYVLGGRAMRICYDAEMVRSGSVAPNTLVDSFVEDAIEIDVDAVSDGEDVLIGAVMEHVEEAGIHSGDSACVIPPLAIGDTIEREVRRQTRELARALGVVGLVNVQFAVRDGEVFVLEANPRASRTVPFVAKATGMPLVEAACRVALGERVRDLGLREATPGVVSVKEAVLPFARFPGADALIGPEMRATGEVMGSGPDFATAFAKAERAAGQPLPTVNGDRQPTVVITVNDRDKPAATMLAELFHRAGFRIYATSGTARAIAQLGTPVEEVGKVQDGSDATTIPDLIASGVIDLVVNTPLGRGARGDGFAIRRAAIAARVPCITTLSGASAAVRSLTQQRTVDPRPLQELHLLQGVQTVPGQV